MKKKITLLVLFVLSIGAFIYQIFLQEHISFVYMISLFMFYLGIQLYDELRKKPLETLIAYCVVFGILTIYGLMTLWGLSIFVLLGVDAVVVYQVYRKKSELY